MLATLLPHLIDLIGVVLTILASVLSVWLPIYLNKRFGFVMSETQKLALHDGAEHAVAFAEEWARARVKQGQPAPNGSAKLASALEFLKTFIKENGYVERSEAYLETLILAKLGVARAEPVAPPAVTDETAKAA